jgi:hypothetical protein
MDDACHLNFGKYTMFSCYGITANSYMLHVCFAIIFGNKNSSSWKDFWWFILKKHSLIDRGEVTIITNQDKGVKAAIKEIHGLVGHFFCSGHQWKNIILQCGGAGS